MQQDRMESDGTNQRHAKIKEALVAFFSPMVSEGLESTIAEIVERSFVNTRDLLSLWDQALRFDAASIIQRPPLLRSKHNTTILNFLSGSLIKISK